MAWKDAKEFVELMRTNPKKAAVILCAIILIVVIGVWARALGELSLKKLDKLSVFLFDLKNDPCETLDPKEMTIDQFIECEQYPREEN